MANIIVLVFLIACIGYQYLKGNLVKAFSGLIAVLVASFIGFAMFEPLAGFIMSHDIGLEFQTSARWLHPLVFVMLFAIIFALEQAGLVKLLVNAPTLGVWPDRIGRAVCGLFHGLVLAGVLFTTVFLTPLTVKLPYQRFESAAQIPDKPKAALFAPADFTIGFFKMVSNGSLSGKRSFSALHPDILSERYLNKFSNAGETQSFTSSAALSVPRKAAVWPAPEKLTDNNANPVTAPSGDKIMVVRLGLRRNALREAVPFTLSQVKILCKLQQYAQSATTGSSRSIYPAGYFSGPARVALKEPDELIRLGSGDFEESVRWLDFCVYVPSGYIPVMAGFKLNNIVEIPEPVSLAKAPVIEPFEEKKPAETKEKTKKKRQNRNNR